MSYNHRKVTKTKIMRNLFVSVLVLCSVSVTTTFVNAQNQANKIDTIGNIGIGTMSPTHQLEVKGRAKIDSTLEVYDSARFRKKVRIEEDLIIEGKTFLRDNGVAHQNFRVQNGFNVDGISHFYNNVLTDSTLRVGKLGLFENNVRVNGQLRTYGINNLFGVSRFHDEVRLLNLNDTSGQNNEGLMMLSGNGKVIRKEITAASAIGQGYNILMQNATGEILKLKFDTLAKRIILGPDIFPPIPCSSPDYIPKWNYEEDQTWIGGTSDFCKTRVGINTNAPQTDLDIHGITRTQKLIIEHNTGDHLMEVIHDNEKMLTLSPNGDLYTQGVKVRPPGQFPDYVFDKTYPLMPLHELQQYIDQHHHLPHMPSAEAVAQEGQMDLGEMNTRLLEKVEELTLYILQQEKRIQNLEERLELPPKEEGQ